MDIKLKENKALSDLRAQLRGASITDSISVFGHKYTLQTLEPRDEDWVNEEGGRAATIAGIAFRMQKPRIAASLLAIDDVNVIELFVLDDSVSKEIRDAIAGNPQRLREWRRAQILAFIEEVFDKDLLDELDAFYSKLTERKRVSLKGMSNF